MSLDENQVIAVLPRNEREETRIGLSTFKGKARCDIRVWYQVNGDYRPGKQGISIALDQLPALQEALQKALNATKQRS